jgi:hypothetical protein
MIKRTQIRMALAALEMNLDEAARSIKVGRATLQRVANSDEGYGKASRLTLERIEDGFDRLGVELVGDYGVSLKRAKT